MKENRNNERKKRNCSELEFELARLMESETQARELLERKYVEGWEDAWKVCSVEAYDKGYAQAVDDTTRKDFELG